MLTPTSAAFAAEPDASGAFVLIPSLDGQARRHGPCLGYKPDFAGVDAQRGDHALIVEDNDGRVWIVAWEPK
jgi:hypothetical protein